MYGEKWAEPSFDAIVFYLHVAGIPLFPNGLMVDMLANEGL